MTTKTIVIVGAGVFGVSIANRLAKSSKDIKVKLISLSKYSAFICSTIRVPVHNDTEGTIFPITDVLNDKVELVIDEVTDITKDSVQLKTNGALNFDALVFATGSKWSNPIVNTHTHGDDYKNYYNDQYEKIKAAKHIVLIGGGFNNVELIGELMHYYKTELTKGEKEITLIHNGTLVLPDIDRFTDSLRQKVTKYLEDAKNVNLILNSRANVLEDDKTVEVVKGDEKSIVDADLVFSSIGVVPSVPPHSLEEFTDNRGFIKVQDTFQSSNPEYSKLFAIGDVNNVEYKGLVHRVSWLKVLEKNILSIVDSATDSPKLNTITRPTGKQPCVVSLGPTHAYGQFPVPFIGTIPIPTWVCVKAKANDLFKSQANEMFHS